MIFKKPLTTILLLSFSVVLFSQAPANSLGGYANVDNNLNKVPRVFIGLNGLVDHFQGIGFKLGGQFKYRNEKFGELQLNASFTPSFLITVPNKPFGPTYRCNCSDNAMNPYTEIDGSYTYYFIRNEKTADYHILLKTAPKISAWPPSFSIGETENLPGKRNIYWGIRGGAAWQNGNLYLLSQQRMLAYDAFDQLATYVGISRTSVGRMFKNFDGHGIRGKNIYHQYYLDGFYAASQNFSVTPVAIYDSQGKLLKEDIKAIPYGARIGATHYHFGYRSNWAWYVGIEAGIRPTFDNMANGAYAGLKLGIGLGMAKTPVYYITSHQSKLYNRKPNVYGNGKYRARKGIDKKTHKRHPLKLIKHRYGK